MTEQQDLLEETDGGEKKRPWLKFVLIGLAMLVVAGLSAGLTLFATGAFSADPPPGTAAGGADVTPQAQYMQMNPPFIVSFETSGRQRFLQVELAVMARDQAVLDLLSTHMPRTRNAIIGALSGQTFDDIRTDPGRRQLLSVVRNVLQEVVDQQGDGGAVERVLLRNFVLQ